MNRSAPLAVVYQHDAGGATEEEDQPDGRPFFLFDDAIHVPILSP